MARAIYNGVVLAEADSFEVVEGNIYFPPDSVKQEYFSASNHATNCPWKGQAAYYNLSVNGDDLKNAAWYYPEPKQAAENIRDHVAFYPGKVQVER
jgi:uncharacterized protein (DUF427 family)